jgi:prevent-host-death family protein
MTTKGIESNDKEPLMPSVSVAKLKAELSRYLDIARAGGEVIVTDRGKPVARIVPIPREMASSVEELLRKGLVRPPLRPLPEDFLDRPRPRDPEGLSLRYLLEERREGR